ncbi:MAG: hypothetical protein H6Q18_306 [Bacteroidetes bacterium]|nr:hypothetical protein [Bacteroidota bacterium]
MNKLKHVFLNEIFTGIVFDQHILLIFFKPYNIMKMKKQALIVLAVLITAFTGCEKLKSLSNFDMPYSLQFTLPKVTDSIKIYIVATGVDPILIVSKTNIPDNVGNTLKFDVDNSINLKEYVNKDKIGLKIVYTTDKKTTENYKITSNVVFTVDPNLFGL